MLTVGFVLTFSLILWNKINNSCNFRSSTFDSLTQDSTIASTMQKDGVHFSTIK